MESGPKRNFVQHSWDYVLFCLLGLKVRVLLADPAVFVALVKPA